MAKVRLTAPSIGVEAPRFRSRRLLHRSAVWWLRFLGVVAFLIVVLRLPRSQDVEVFHIDLRWLGLCMLLTIAQLLLEALVWHWLIAAQRIRYPYPKTLLAYLSSQYLGLVTPGHVGEFLAAGYISMDTGITFGYALSSVVMKKVLAWITVVSFGVWGLQLLMDVPLLQSVQWAALASAGVLVVLSAGIALWVLSLRRLAKRWERFSPWQIDMTEFHAGMRELLSVKLVVPLAMVMAAFSLLFLQLEAILRALGVTLSLFKIAQIVAFSRIVARVVPISVVGFGSKDAAVIGMLAQEGVAPAVGLTATLLLLVCSYLVTLLLSGLCWWIKPLTIRRQAPPGV